ncbi:MAG: TRAP transporter substrate-binding protein [Marinobacterium sp.]|nr:TRAP transporter substrate-binding protein [Marinobacterium sp.]
MKFGNRVLKAAALATMMMGATAWGGTWKVAVGDGGGSAQETLGLKFAEIIEQRTDGKQKMALFLNGQLGSEQDTVNELAIGTLDFSILASNNLAPFSPSLGALSMPYLIRSVDEAEKIVNGPIGEELINNTVRDAGARILGWTFSGFRVLSNSKRPVNTLADLQGMVVRVPRNEIMIDTYKAWGINPTPMAWTETFTALQQGVVDGQDTPYITIYSMKFQEVQKYITDLHYLFLLEPLVVSESLFQAQDASMQKLLVEAGKEATTYSVQWLKEQEDNIRGELVDSYGMEISTPADEDKWAQLAVEKVWPKHYDSIGGKEKLNVILRAIGRKEI